MATEKKEKTEEQSQLDCIAAALRVLTSRVDRMQENWLKYWKVAIGPGAYPKNKPGQVGMTRIGHVLALLAASAGVAVLAWAAGEVANWTSGSGTTRIDQSTQSAEQILVVDEVRCGGITNTGPMALNGNVTLGDSAVLDSHTINGPVTMNSEITLISTNGAYTNTVKSTAVGSVTFGRPTAGSVTLTATDNDATANIVVAAGGNGSVSLGDSAVLDTVVLYGPVTMYDVTLLSTNAASTNTIKTTAVGTVTFGRPTAGSVTLTATDDDTTANVVVKAGGNGSVTLGDSAASDTVVLYGALTQNGDVTLLDSTAAYTNILKSTAVGTLTVNRPTSGTVTITSTDDDANAALTVVAGGTGALTVGDTDSATTLEGSSIAMNPNVTIGNSAVLDSHTIHGLVTANSEITLVSTNAAATNTVKSTATGTITVGRPDSGTITLTSADDDANAALTIAAGGTGALTVGDAGSATTVTGSSVDLLKGSTAGSMGIAVGPSATVPMIQYYTLTGDNQHDVITQALTTAYGDAVVPSVVASPSAANAAFCVSTVASNSFQVTITPATVTIYAIVAGPQP